MQPDNSSRTAPEASLFARCIVGLISVVFCFLALEFGLRLVADEPLLGWEDLRQKKLIVANFSEASKYDPTLGWAMVDFHRSAGFNTLEHGIRRNFDETTSLRGGGILVVGDSFAAGSQVNDEDSWPAQLERELGVPVANAATGNYGIDQMALRARALMPELKPATVVFGFTDQAILRVAFSTYGLPKPYFRMGASGLELQNVPVPAALSETPDLKSTLMNFGAHLISVDRLMANVNPDSWYGLGGKMYRGVGVDPVDVSCAILKEFQTEFRPQGVRVLALIQFGGQTIATEAQKPNTAVALRKCLEDSGVQTVDEYDLLRGQLAQLGLRRFKSLYMMAPDADVFEHMSPDGNRLIMQLAAQALRDPPPEERPPVAAAPRAGMSGDGRNLAGDSERLDGAIATANAKVDKSWALPARLWPRHGPLADWFRREYRVEPIGPAAEHYAAVAIAQIPAGGIVLTFEAKAETVERLRVQLLDSGSNGVLADVDLTNRSVAMTRLGVASGLQAAVDHVSGKWHKIALQAVVPGGRGQVIFQLLDRSGKSNFSPQGQSVTFRNVRLETFPTSAGNQATAIR